MTPLFLIPHKAPNPQRCNTLKVRDFGVIILFLKREENKISILHARLFKCRKNKLYTVDGQKDTNHKSDCLCGKYKVEKSVNTADYDEYSAEKRNKPCTWGRCFFDLEWDIATDEIPSTTSQPEKMQRMITSNISLMPGINIARIEITAAAMPTTRPSVPIIASLCSAFAFLRFAK